jgi:hypothetical protein
LARERGDEVSRSVDLKIKEAMAHKEKEEKIKNSIEEKKDIESKENKKDKEPKEKKKDKEPKEKKKDKESKEKKVVVVDDSDEELSDDGEFFLRDRPALT